VLEWEYGKYAVGYKLVSMNEQFFTGHFPQRAIMPGAPLDGVLTVPPLLTLRWTLCAASI
jgi:hypothetical protein